jgi:hypothetical protein
MECPDGIAHHTDVVLRPDRIPVASVSSFSGASDYSFFSRIAFLILLSLPSPYVKIVKKKGGRRSTAPAAFLCGW